MRHRVSSRVVIWTILALTAVPACDTNDRLIAAPQQQHFTEHASQSLSPEGYPQITDDEGTQWTLQTDQQQLVASTGETVALTSSQTASYSNAFFSVINDAPTTLEAMLAANPPPGNSGCTGMPDNPCDEYKGILALPGMRASSSSLTAESKSTTRRSRLLNSHKRNRGVDPASVNFASVKKLAGSHTRASSWLLRPADNPVARLPMHGRGVLRSGFTTGHVALGQRTTQAEQR